MQMSENRQNAMSATRAKIEWIADFERCADIRELHVVMDEINRCQYQLVSVTQGSDDVYAVFFRRCVVG